MDLALKGNWAATFAPFGVRVNAVIPAEVKTRMYANRIKTFAAGSTRRRRPIYVCEHRVNAAYSSVFARFSSMPVQPSVWLFRDSSDMKRICVRST